MNHKHHHIIALLLGAGLLGLSGIASAAITNSKHDLSSANTTAGVNKVSDTAETCVFCHTPHAAAGNTVPLWNKQLTSSAGYTPYSSTTMDGTADFNSSTSMACLSCHDGTQAMDNIVNASGSGNYNATGGGTNGLGYTWSGTTVDATGKLVTTALTNLSTNLGDDHPVAIPYGGGGVTIATPTAAPTDPDFRKVGDTVTLNAVTYTMKNAAIGGQTVIWFDSGVNNTRIDSTEIRLYTVAGKANPQVECASCHDPHKGENPTFLRIANTQSAVCVTCHVK